MLYPVNTAKDRFWISIIANWKIEIDWKRYQIDLTSPMVFIEAYNSYPDVDINLGIYFCKPKNGVNMHLKHVYGTKTSMKFITSPLAVTTVINTTLFGFCANNHADIANTPKKADGVLICFLSVLRDPAAVCNVDKIRDDYSSIEPIYERVRTGKWSGLLITFKVGKRLSIFASL